MESRQKFIEDKEYDIADFFLEALQDEFDLPIALKIAEYLEETKIEVASNNLVSYILGGTIMYDKDPIFFAIEIVRPDSEYMTFTDIKEISMDDSKHIQAP